MEEEQKIFKKNSTTFYFASKLLPKRIREDIYRLYSFVHTAHTYAHEDPKKLHSLEQAYSKAINDHTYDATAHKWDELDVRVVKHIVRLQHKHKFEQEWVDAYFKAMNADAEKKVPNTLEDSLDFVYGSAEVVGLMLAKILKLPEQAYDAARAQARASQWADFIRDLGKDSKEGHSYFPKSDLKKFNLKELNPEVAKESPEKVTKFVQLQVDRYKKWEKEAQKGIQFVPERLRVGVKTVADMYEWTIRKVAKHPLSVFQKQITPRKRQVLRQVIKNTAQGTARVTARTTRQAKKRVKSIRPAAKTIPKVIGFRKV